MSGRRRSDASRISDESDSEGDIELEQEFIDIVAGQYGRCEKKQCEEIRLGMAKAIQTLDDREEDREELKRIRKELKATKAKLVEETRARKDAVKKFNNLDRQHQELKVREKSAVEDLDVLKQRMVEAQQDLVEARREATDARHSRRRRTKDKHKIGDFIEENIRLNEELQTVTNRAEMFATTLEDMEKEREKFLAQVEALKKALEEANDDIDRLKAEEEEASRALEEEEEESEMLKDQINQLNRQLERASAEREEAVAAVQRDVEQRDRKVRELQQALERMNDQTALRELRAEIEARDEEIADLKAAFDESEAQKAQIKERVEHLTERISELGDEWAEQAMEQTQLKDLEIKKLERELAAKNRMLQEADNRTQNFMLQKRNVDEQLVQLREHVEEVERAKNMHGVTARFKVMLGKIQAREQELHKARLELSNRTLDLNTLHEIARRLAVEAGHPADVDLTKIYPELDIQRSIRGAVASWRARCEELEQQNEALEDERLALLAKARERAQLLAKGLNLKGLSVEDAMKVDAYARNLREGRDQKPFDERAYDLFQQNKHLKKQLEEKEVEVASLVTRLRRSRGKGAAPHFDADDELGPISMGADGGGEVATSQVLEGMQRMMADMKREYNAKMEAMSKRHAEAIKRAMGSRPPASPRVGRSESKRQSVQDRQLQKALAKVAKSGAPSQEILETMRETYSKLSADNETLRAQLGDEQARYEEAHGEAQRLMGVEQELRSQVQNLQGRATKAEADAMSKARTINQLEEQIKNMQGGGGRRGMVTPSPRNRRTSNGRRSSGGSQSYALRVPMTPSGKQVHRKSIASMALPGEPWVEEVNNINAQLIECLEELAKKDDELRKTESSLSTAEHNLGSMAAQQAVLYRDHIEAFDEWVRRTKELQSRVDEQQLAAADLKAKADRLDKLTSVLEETDEARLRDEVRVLTRDLAKYETEQPVLARKYNLSVQEAELARKEAANVRREFIDMQKTYQWRILYLELWKSGAEERLERLSGIADSWVPQYDYKRVNDQLARMSKQYNELLAAETALRSQFIEVRSAPRAKIALESELEVLKVDLEVANRERAAAQSELQVLTAELAAKVEAATDDASRDAMMDNMLLQCAKFRGESARLEIMHDTVQRRLAARTKEAKEFKAQLDLEVTRATKAEEVARKAQAERQEAVAKLEALQADMSGALSQEKARELQDRVTELESMYKGVCREVHRLKEDAHIAHSQASMLSAAQKRQKDDVTNLREQIRTLSAKGDDEAIIGSLQHKYLALKNEYHTFAVEYERMREDHQAAKHSQQVLQMALDEAAAKLQVLREETRVRELAVQRAMDEVRSQRAGGLTIEETRALSIQLIKLEKTSEAQAKELDRAAAMRKAADTRAAAKALEVQKLSEQLEDFKKAASSQGGDFGAMIRRLADLSEQLRITQLKELRQTRELASLREEKRTFDARRRKDESRMRELDNRVVTAENNLRLRHDAHRAELQKLKAQLAAAGGSGGADHVDAAPRARGAQASDSGGSGAADAGDAGDGSGSGVDGGVEANVSDSELRARLEAALAQLRTDTVSLRERNEEIAALKRKVSRLEAEAEDAKHDHTRMRKLAKRMRSKLRRNGIDVYEDEHVPLEDDDDSDDDSDDGGSMGDPRDRHGRSEEIGLATKMARDKRRKLARVAKELKADNEKLKLVAQEKIDSLRAVVAKKNLVIQAYQERLERARAERDAERQEESVTRENLVEQAYEENKNIIRKLRQAVEQLQGAPMNLADNNRDVAVTAELMERNEELQKQLLRKETELYKAQQTMSLLEQALAHEKNRTSEALMEAEVARGEATKAQIQTKTHDNKKLVATLKAHLKAKEKKIRSLSKQINSLKVEYAKEQAELAKQFETVRQNAGVRNAVASGGDDAGTDPQVLDKIEKLRARATQLEHRLKRATLKLQEAQAGEGEARRAQKTIASNLDRAVKQAAQHETAARASASTLARCQRELDDARRQVRELRDRNQRGGGRSGGSGDAEGRAAAEAQVKQLQRRVRMLEAQNAAYAAEAAEASQQRRSRDPAPSAPAVKGATTPAGLQPTEAMKKLQRKVEWSVRTLAEKNRELQSARADAEASRTELQRVQGELKRAQSRLRLASKQKDSSGGRAMSVLRELAPAMQLRDRIAELEDANVALSARLQSEVDGKVRQLNAQVEALEGQLEAARSAERDAVERLQSFEAMGKQGDERSQAWRRSEDRYVSEASLREQLSEVRKRLADAEAELVTKQAGALELQFENTRLQSDVDRLQRRVEELSSVKELLSQVPGVGGSAGGTPRGRGRDTGGGGGGASARRVRELESVVQELTKVADKRRQEAERLRKLMAGGRRRGSGAGVGGGAETAAELEEARKKLRAANAKVGELERRVTLLESDVRRARAAAKKARADGSAAGEASAGGAVDAEAQETIRRLRTALNGAEEDVANMRAELTEARRRRGGAGGSAGAGGGPTALHSEVERLRTLNAQLKSELSAFDAQFFNEIEDMKYLYEQTRSKYDQHLATCPVLRQQHAMAPPGGRRGMGGTRHAVL